MIFLQTTEQIVNHFIYIIQITKINKYTKALLTGNYYLTHWNLQNVGLMNLMMMIKGTRTQKFRLRRICLKI